jgi:hypothetical protein
MARARKEQGYYSVYYDALVHDTTLLTLISRHFPAQTKKVPAALLDKFGERISRNEYHSLSAANMIRAMDLYDAQVAANGDIKVRAQLKDKQMCCWKCSANRHARNCHKAQFLLIWKK